MADAHNYMVPEYYSGFSCKGGACRSTCCSGWGISLSMKEYFRLLGMECSPELRRKIDGSFHPADHPTAERYVQITPNWLGRCPMHMDNGLCQLHAECGEEALTAVCRYYPRGVHTALGRECSCANSCERVLEMLFARKEPMRFHEMELCFEEEMPVVRDELAARYFGPVRKRVIGALQDRNYALVQRLMLAGGMAALLNEAFAGRDEWVIAGALELCGRMTPPEKPVKDEKYILGIVYGLMRMFSENASVEGYIEEAMELLGFREDKEPDDEELARAAGILRRETERFEGQFPDWERMFEQMMVNHVFFDGFPFSDRHENLWEAYESLCAAYCFVRFLAITGTAGRAGEEALVDVCAAAFRLIEHSGFDRNSMMMLKRQGADSLSELARLIMI